MSLGDWHVPARKIPLILLWPESARPWSSSKNPINISDILVESISQYSITFFLVNTILPAIIGFIAANYCINSLKQGKNVAMRIIVLLVLLLISQFIDVYVTAARQNGLLYSNELLPNISFILAVIFYIIFRYPSEETKAT